MNLQDIQHLFAYTEWANELALDAADNLSEEQLRHDFRISYSSIFGTLLHSAGAEWLWLQRWRGGASRLADWQQWSATHGTDVATLRRVWRQVADERRAFLAEVDEARLAADFTYPQSDGTLFTLPLAAQMQHVANHSTLHRGQVVGMLRQLGVKPPSTDLFFYLREQRQAKR